MSKKPYMIDPATGKALWTECTGTEREKQAPHGSNIHNTRARKLCGAQDHEVADHLCNRTWCENPEHIEAVSQSENIKRAYARGTKFYVAPHWSYETIRTVVFLRLGCGWKYKDIRKLTGVKAPTASNWCNGVYNKEDVRMAVFGLGLA